MSKGKLRDIWVVTHIATGTNTYFFYCGTRKGAEAQRRLYENKNEYQVTRYTPAKKQRQP